MGGWVMLRPGPEVSARALSAAERLDVLVRFRPLSRLAPPGPQLLDLIELPAYELRHPCRWERLDDVCDQIEQLASR
ncbi:MAG: hypothetical protein M3Z27_01320 [Actinomycetota bacterium]|nr:hypothetical protein [Actinomycetota bacterium]